MTTITIKNIPEELYERLKESARANHRSINKEIIACIEDAVESRVVNPEEWLARARILREGDTEYTITDGELDQAKRTGRL